MTSLRRRIAAAASSAVATLAVAASAAVLAPAASASGTTRPTDAHSELMAPYLRGPGHDRVADIDVRHDRVLNVAQGRNLSTTRAAPAQEATYADKLEMLTNRGIPLTGITVYDWTPAESPVVSGNRYATWPQPRASIDVGGTLTSEGYRHQFRDDLTPTQRWQDACGVLSDYGGRGYDASTLCSHGGCVTRSDTCFGKGGACGYDSIENLRSTLVPGVGKATVLQYYHLLVGKGPTWDCTSPRHQTSTTESYCLSDVMSLPDTLPRDVKVATTADLASAVGRAPEQLPGITLEDYVCSQHP